MADSGKFDEMKGRLEKGFGEVTNRQDIKNQGNVDKASGKLKQGVENLKEKAQDFLDRNKDENKNKGY